MEGPEQPSPRRSYGTSDNEKTPEVHYASSTDNAFKRGRSNLSMDDIEAAQALEDLRANFGRTKYRRQENDQNANIDPALQSPPSSSSAQKQPETEPLLSLLTSQHPILSNAVNGSLSAYTSSKSYSPRFKYGAELVERHIGHPVASTVTTASRLTGVDSAARWFYRRPASGKKEGGSKKRRVGDKAYDDERDIERGIDDSSLLRRSRRDSGMSMGDPLVSPGEPLPLYEPEGRSPSYQSHQSFVQQESELPSLRIPMTIYPAPNYTRNPSVDYSLASPTEPLPSYDPEGCSPTYQQRESSVRRGQGARPTQDATGRSSMTMVTSALSIVISQRSLNSLKECLRFLREANEKIGWMATKLKDVIEGKQDEPATETDGDAQSKPGAILQTIHDLKTGINDTYSKALGHISELGALPVNIGEQIRTHIFSLPRRVFFALRSKDRPRPSIETASTPNTSDTKGAEERSADTESGLPEKEIKSAQRVVIMATEMLDVLSQVSGIVGGTIDNAEQWLDRIGQRQRRRSSDEARPTPHGKDGGIEKVANENVHLNGYARDVKTKDQEDVEMK